jgi:hypothetical protein
MKIILLSLLAISLVICVLYYEHSQIIKKFNKAKTETFFNEEELAPTADPALIQEQIGIMNSGGSNTVSSSLCDRMSSIDSIPKDTYSFNSMFGKMNYAFDAMFKNLETYKKHKV